MAENLVLLNLEYLSVELFRKYLEGAEHYAIVYNVRMSQK